VFCHPLQAFGLVHVGLLHRGAAPEVISTRLHQKRWRSEKPRSHLYLGASKEERIEPSDDLMQLPNAGLSLAA
jgi:hypothetical protein